MKNNIVLFCGDVAASDASREYFAKGDIQTLFSDLLPLMEEADNVVINLETAVTDKETKIRKHGPNIKSPVQTVDTLKTAGVTACGLANNHVGDYAEDGLLDTFAYLEKADMPYFGAGRNEEEAVKPYFFTSGDKKIAMIAVGEHEYTYAIDEHPGAAPFDPFDTLLRIRDAKAEADYVVVMYHGGKEQCEYPSPRLRKACHAFCELGADLVLCQHSHIIGTWEEFGDSRILYGQGNFNFMNYLPLKGWTTGLIVKATFGDKMETELIPITSEPHGMRLAVGEEKEAILKGLEERSKALYDGTWMDGWKAFVEEVKEPYIQAVVHAGHGDDPILSHERFCHYLDCEAHTDVWRELFPTWHAAGVDGSWELK